MDPIEKAIRNAFSKGDSGDPSFREKIYRSAFNALDRTLQANPAITVEKAIARRKKLQAQITAIETEFIPPRQPPAAAPTLDNVDRRGSAGMKPAGDQRFEPQFGEDPDGFALSPGLAGDPAEVKPDPDPRRARRPRRGWALLFLVAVLLALAGMGYWWAVQTGQFLSPEERDTSVPNPPATLPAEDFAPPQPDGQAAAPPSLGTAPPPDRNWIGIFSAADPSAVSVPSGASADAMQVDGDRFLRVRSGDADSSVTFDVGQGLLQQLAGQRAVFSIVARAEGEGAETEIAVNCDFGALGDCGRRRYAVGLTAAENLFEVDLPQGSPSAGGTIALNSDVSGGGRAVDIFEIKVAVGP